MDYNWLLEAGKIAGALTAIGAAVFVVIKYVVLKPLEKREQHIVEMMTEKFEDMLDHIDERTYPIQPNSNGGKSLADVNKKMIALDSRIDILEENQNLMIEILTTPKVTKPKRNIEK